MDELARKIAVARQGLSTSKNDEWLERLAHDFQMHRRRRVQMRRAGWCVAGVAGVALAATAVIAERRIISRSPEGAEMAAALVPLRIPDGSTATPFDELTVLRIKETSDALSVMDLVRGGARFNVAHRPSRLFRVEAGPAVIEVLGTEFTVERIASRVRVSVLSGQVQVDCEGHTTQLVEGDTGIFPRVRRMSEAGAAEEPTADAPSSPNPPDTHAVDVDTRAKSARGGQWRGLATQGKLPEAYQALEHDGWSIGDDPTSLLLAADVARRTHHPAQAVAPLRKMVDGYAKDPRAAAAAFTLGRVLMEIGELREAAAAFAKTRSLDQQGAITEDALAREVEAWSRAGDKVRARARAEEYAVRYPSGRRLPSVRQYAGME